MFVFLIGNDQTLMHRMSNIKKRNNVKQGKGNTSFEQLKSDDSSSRLQRLKRMDTPRTITVKKQLAKSPYLPALDKIPEHLRYGPWSPLSYMYLLFVLVGFFYFYKDAMQSFPVNHIPQNGDILINSFFSGAWRLGVSIYGFIIIVVLCAYSGMWPMASFTMLRLFVCCHCFSFFCYFVVQSVSCVCCLSGLIFVYYL